MFCEVMIGTLEVNHTFIVAEITDEIIMGVDFMIDHGVTLDLHKQMLFCQNMEMPINTGYVTNVESKRVIVDDNQSIPPKSEAIVSAKVNGGGGTEELWIVEPTKIDTPILVGRTLVKTREDATIPVRVVNEFNTPISLKKGAVIGQYHNISAIARCERSQQKPTIEPQQISPTLLNNLLNELHGNEKLKAEKLLEKYSSIFANEGNTGRTGIVKHRINTGDAKPIRQAPRRVPLAKREDANKIIEDMHKNGVIEPSISPWSSPIVLVKKKDGSTRFCVDYRKLNDVTKKDSYPLPRIDDTLDTLSGAKWFSTLDLQSGYWQVEIDECDREKTAFSMGDGLWEFSVMPFGLCNAPATFERLMEHVLKGLNWKTCLVYLDDIIIMGKSFDDHLKNLEEVFQRIASAGLRLNPKKCSLWKKQVTYLGHKVSTEGIHTEEGKIKAVKDWPQPTNIHELRSFLGLCTYYRRFVPGFANVARSLHDLTKKNRPFVWQLEQEKAFEQLKELLCTSPMLAYPIPGKKFIVDTDARVIISSPTLLLYNKSHIPGTMKRQANTNFSSMCLCKKLSDHWCRT
ncbi:retrovirus-related Pol polyprotein from transposon 17.6 isoform X1 [Bactrocera dorsalis]|uniref:Retrovirus-related Pol polyprotein from transposon 17.6 isoform X1 n=1 Tax=Bactrocera dorsalis TaxID=27457 RepID=A0ABM3JAN4_BACDO|nr:retrovirus-related Pol polyprotein from transposon 17.6 isoform X1 [Bactrocera dorsalis]